MTKRTLSWTFEELGKAMNKSLEVEFECDVSIGSPGSYWEPPEPTEIEFTDVTIVKFLGADGDFVGPASWHAPSWLKFLKDIAFGLADKHRQRLEETLLENTGDADYGDLDDYYDRKRDERRGC